MPAVEEFGVEPVPRALRNVGWLDFLRMAFAMHFNPLQYVLGALAVVAGGLPLWWAATAIAAGNGLAFALLVVAGQAGVDYGLSGQVAMRATFGEWGARGLTSPYRILAATYLFGAQALAGGLGVQAIARGLTGHHVALVPIALVLAIAEVVVAIVGFRALQGFARAVLPLMFVFAAAVVVLYLTTSDPSYQPSRVFASPRQSLTWEGFASFVTVMCSGALSNVTNVADLCRYGRSRTDLRVGFLVGATVGAFVTAWVGAYAAVATGSMNPFVAIADLTSSTPLLLVFLVAIVAQTASVSILNVYSVGLSLTNVIPRLGRVHATVLAGAAAVGVAAFPDFINEAQKWITYFGNVAAPLTGVILADYAILKRTRISIDDLFRPQGRYRYLRGFNPASVAAVAVGAGVYYAVPDAWVKVVWGVAAGGAAYLALAAAQGALVPRLAAAQVTRRAAS